MKKWLVVAYVPDENEPVPRKEFEIYAEEKEDVERAARHTFAIYPMFKIFEQENEEKEQTNEEVADSSICGE
jgi:hypothetical protein